MKTITRSPQTKLIAARPTVPLPPATTPSTNQVFAEIQVRAETVTLVLKEILEIRPPPHWGINE